MACILLFTGMSTAECIRELKLALIRIRQGKGRGVIHYES